MKNDYLWDKKGSDAEIEKLENALKVFRYQPNSPQVFAAANVQAEEKQAFSLFSGYLRFAFAGFALIAIAIAGIGFWLSKSSQIIAVVPDASKPIVTPVAFENPVNERFVTTVATAITKPKTAFVSKPTYTKTNRLQKQTQIAFRHVPKLKKKKSVTLSDEEQYAYEQLMLALSITSSRLKEVKDKANGGEEKTAKIDSLR